MGVAQELDLERIALAALAEDVGGGDLTTEATVAEDATCTATLLLKEPGVVSGLLRPRPSSARSIRTSPSSPPRQTATASSSRPSSPASPAARAPC